MKKKILVITAIVAAVILALPIGILAYAHSQTESYYTEDLDEYGIYENHMAMEREMMQTDLLIFPSEELARDCGQEYIYDCGVLSMASNYYFVYLECEYTQEQLQAEVARLQQVEVAYEHTTKRIAAYGIDADTTIYVTVLEDTGSREYAIVDGATIQYVYNRYDDSLEKKYVDKQYWKILQEWDKETEDYNIYEFGTPYALTDKTK